MFLIVFIMPLALAYLMIKRDARLEKMRERLTRPRPKYTRVCVKHLKQLLPFQVAIVDAKRCAFCIDTRPNKP